MANRRPLRPGHRWQPALVGTPARRVAGRRRWPRPRPPQLSLRWRRALLLAVVVGAVVLAGWWLYRSPLLSLREVEIEGTYVLSADEVRRIADLEGQSLLRPDFAGARERLLALPLVKEVRVSRAWPADARISVVERGPAAVWQASGQRYIIDDEGVVLPLPLLDGLPVIVQTDAAPLLAPGDRVDPGAVAAAVRLVPTAPQTLGRTVSALEFSQARGLTAVLTAGDGSELRVTFGDARAYDFKVAALYAVLDRAAEEGRTLRRVDLRFGDRVAVQ